MSAANNAAGRENSLSLRLFSMPARALAHTSQLRLTQSRRQRSQQLIFYLALSSFWC